MRVFYLLGIEPNDEVGKVISDFFPIEDTIDHMAAEHPHLYFVFGMRVDIFVKIDRSEDVCCNWTVGKFEFIEGLLVDGQFVADLEVFNIYFFQYQLQFIISVLKYQMNFHVLFIQTAKKFLKIWSLSTLNPLFALDVHPLKRFWHFTGGKVVEEGVRIEKVGSKEVELGC